MRDQLATDTATTVAALNEKVRAALSTSANPSKQPTMPAR